MQDVLAEEVSDPEDEEESLDPPPDPQLTAAAPSGVAPTSEAAVAPSGVALRPLGAGVGLQAFGSVKAMVRKTDIRLILHPQISLARGRLEA